MLGVGLPVELRPAGEFAFHELVGHGLAGEIKRALTDRRVAVGVGRAEGVPGEPADQVAAAGFQAPQMKAIWLFFGPKSG